MVKSSSWRPGGGIVIIKIVDTSVTTQTTEVSRRPCSQSAAVALAKSYDYTVCMVLPAQAAPIPTKIR